MEPKFAETKKVDTERISFYATYINQTVLETPHMVYTGYPNPEPDYEVWGPETLTMQNLERSIEFNFPLFLTPLMEISDEDCIFIAKALNFTSNLIENGRAYIKEFAPNMSASRTIHSMSNCLIIDYLRSKGYALPWREYSVMELIEKGWIFLGETVYHATELIEYYGKKSTLLKKINDKQSDKPVIVVDDLTEAKGRRLTKQEFIGAVENDEFAQFFGMSWS